MSDTRQKRSLTRTNIYVGEGIFVRIVNKISEDEKKIVLMGEMINLSAQGFGVLLAEKPLIDDGALVSLEIAPRGRRMCSTEGVVVHTGSFVKRSKNAWIIGIKVVSRYIVKKNIPLLSSRSGFAPTVFFEHPWFCNQFVYLEVKRLGSNLLECAWSETNTNMFVGLNLDVHISFPIIGSVLEDVEVIYYDQVDDNILIYVRLLDPSPEYLSLAGQYLVTAGFVDSIVILQEYGFIVENIADSMDFTFARNKTDLDGVANLRSMSYGSEVPMEVFDRFDEFSRQLVVIHAGRVIACTRIVYNDNNRDMCEHESYGFEIPKWLWKAGFVETSRMSIHPNYRGSDIFLRLMAHMGQTVLQSGNRYMVASCSEVYLPSYLSSGCRKIGHFDNEDGRWFMVVLDVAACFDGSTVGPLVWNLLHYKAAEYLLRVKTVSRGSFTWMRVLLYRLLRPAILYLKSRKIRKRAAMKDAIKVEVYFDRRQIMTPEDSESLNPNKKYQKKSTNTKDTVTKSLR